jgi:hypothetical protein
MTTSHSQISESSEGESRSFLGIIVHSFFIIPFLIAVFCLLLFWAVNLLTREQQTAYDYLEDVQTGGSSKRWQAAFELSKILAHPDLVPQDEHFISELIYAYRSAGRHMTASPDLFNNNDFLVQQYLALAMGRTGNHKFFEPLTESIATQKGDHLYAVIYALGMLGDQRATEILRPYLKSPEARIRSVVVVALGNLEDPQAVASLKECLPDQEPNVRWGAALSLARLGDPSGKQVIQQLLDRRYFGDFSQVDPQEQTHLILAAIQAVIQLKADDLLEPIERLAHSDSNMKVRAAAFEAVNLLKSSNLVKNQNL